MSLKQFADESDTEERKTRSSSTLRASGSLTEKQFKSDVENSENESYNSSVQSYNSETY